jgi:tetratricopeptide (TPR) repeat protein
VGIFERYNEDARRTVLRAKHEADAFGSLELGAEHILLALLRDSVLISSTMEKPTVAFIRAALHAHIPRLEPNPLPHDLPLSVEARTVLMSATEEADSAGQQYVRNAHVLLALARSNTSYAAQLLKEKGFFIHKLQLQIKAFPQDKQAQQSASKSAQSRPEAVLTRRVGELVSRGEGQKAMEVLASFMAEPGQDRRLRLRLMGGFATVIALQVGDLKAARSYCEERVSYTPDDPMALFQLADCLAREGEVEEARRRATDCRKAALAHNEERGKRIVELVEKRFPELNRRV